VTKKLEMTQKQAEGYREGLRRGICIGNRLGLKGIKTGEVKDADS
jgi:hypothetical protein